MPGVVENDQARRVSKAIDNEIKVRLIDFGSLYAPHLDLLSPSVKVIRSRKGKNRERK